MTDTINLGLPFIDGNQAQKHVTHNEALRILDAAIQIAVADTTRTVPPASPATGDRHVVAGGASGAWTGHDGAIATWEDGAWAFLAPKAGWWLWSVADASIMIFDGAAWLPFAPPADNVGRLGVNTTASAPNLLSVKSNAALLAAIAAADGGSGDARLQISKETAAGTASVFFSDDYSGRAEFGLTGDDDFHLKVSPDGTNWQDAFVIDKATASVAFNGFTDAGATRAAIGADVLTGFRNRIIDGDFNFWSTGTSFSASGYTADMWWLGIGSGAACSVSRAAFSAGSQVGHASPRYYLTWARSTAGTAASVLQQSIEGVRTFEGRTVTVTFWANASASTDVAVDLVQIFGTGGSPSAAVYTATQVCSLTTSLQKFTFTVSVPSIAGKTLGSNDDDCLRLRFIRAHTSVNPTAQVSLAHVSVVLGDATKEDDPSPPIDIETERARCQRYYEQCMSDDIGGGFIGCASWFGSATGPMNIQATALFRVKKRAVPTVTGTIRGSSGNFSSLTPSMGATVFGVNNTMNVNGPASNTYVTTYWTADARL